MTEPQPLLETTDLPGHPDLCFSSFRDMHAERELFVKQVFPELRRLCAERFVTLAAGLDGDRELVRPAPFFES